MAENAEYLAACDAVLAQWPVEVEAVDVSMCRLRIELPMPMCGLREGSPLVLLHCGGATGTVWFAYVGALSQSHRVYAVDTIGAPGRSVNDGQPLRTRADLMAWLDEVLDGLQLGHASMCGHSYGSWLALNYAIHAPHRVHRLALLDPTECFARLRLQYRLRAVPLFVRPRAERMLAFVRWETAGAPVDPTWLGLRCLGTEFPHAKIVMPRHPTAERLRATTGPTLVLLASGAQPRA